MSDPAPSPDLFFETITAYQRVGALKGALDLYVFSAIGPGQETAPDLAARCGASPRGVRILCDYLTTLGFLVKEGDRYGLTADSAAFLDRRSPTHLGPTLEFLLAPPLIEAFGDVAAAVRRGGTILPQSGSLAPGHPVWAIFARVMAPAAAAAARPLADLVSLDPGRRSRVLDLAAGHGLFGITIAQRYPSVEVVALDWPNVLEVARENARAAGVSDRFRSLPGSALEVEYGAGYDLVLLTNFLHHFDPAACRAILRKAHAALAPGGRAVTVEIMPDESRVSPPRPARFALVMLCTTPSGDAYTFPEYEQMLRDAGFARSERHPLPPTPQEAIVSHR